MPLVYFINFKIHICFCFSTPEIRVFLTVDDEKVSLFLVVYKIIVYLF